jgi:hypothetical protein
MATGGSNRFGSEFSSPHFVGAGIRCLIPISTRWTPVTSMPGRIQNNGGPVGREATTPGVP